MKLGIGLIVLLALGASSRSATIAKNEAAVMEDLRSVVAAQAAYQAHNCGHYADLGCLVHPLPCGLRAAPPPLIDSALGNLRRRHGYRRAFYPGRRVELGGGRACSASSFVGYAYTAVPEREGVTGNRAFCIDESGFMRQFDSGTGVAGGRCLPGLMAEEAPAVSADEQERRVIADLRTLASAEEAYQASNGGFYDQTRCLAEPWVCVPRYPREAPVFIEPRIADLRERHGYRRRFYPGVIPPTINRWSSPSSLLGYAYTATPVRDGPPGRRGFCLDASGGMCQTADGSEPTVADGKCQACEPLVER